MNHSVAFACWTAQNKRLYTFNSDGWCTLVIEICNSEGNKNHKQWRMLSTHRAIRMSLSKWKIIKRRWKRRWCRVYMLSLVIVFFFSFDLYWWSFGVVVVVVDNSFLAFIENTFPNWTPLFRKEKKLLNFFYHSLEIIVCTKMFPSFSLPYPLTYTHIHPVSLSLYLESKSELALKQRSYFISLFVMCVLNYNNRLKNIRVVAHNIALPVRLHLQIQ